MYPQTRVLSRYAHDHCGEDPSLIHTRAGDGIDLQIFDADQDHRQTVPSRRQQTVPIASGSGIWGLEQWRSGMLDGWIR